MAPASLPLNLNLKLRSQLQTNKVAELPEKTRNSRVLVLGGTGRVGGSTAIALSNLCPDLRIVVAGRNREKGEAMVAKLGGNSGFAHVDIDDVNSLETALKSVDLVVHAAGPFQQAERCSVLEAAIKTKTAYLDVCDDTTYAWRAKSFMSRALAANVPAITTGGIYPGVSNVMAAELVRAAESESKDKPERLRNLPEVRSAHEILGVPTVSARFGTAPFFWNWGMEAMTKLLPSEFLRDRNRVGRLVELFDPVVRAIDGIAGERVSMRVELECSSGRNTVGIFSHRRLSVCVGIATAAFALAILEGSTQPGVWFPEEVFPLCYNYFIEFYMQPEGLPIEAREVLLMRARQGTINFVMNKSPWMIETDPKELGLGIYV
ncbi:uncharacterized protein LOC133306173 isoform X3 [Gastrolobium bilobum]|uniref:uncharacterized protein LOC133306173 isoform X3 n=1 Tax=Gastrolobium bilobum TaxID=150636 RepID=UPI002AB16EC8|nr:uncharacterized protein LOC133306173 isoform X3 [Gastrolobium bilobum]